MIIEDFTNWNTFWAAAAEKEQPGVVNAGEPGVEPIKQGLSEGLTYKSLTGILKPMCHIDEFSSMMGDDDDICVISFLVKNEKAADDLVAWFEGGYDFVLDADRSVGEIDSNQYLVYVELKRRFGLTQQVHDILDDLQTLTEWKISDWRCQYKQHIFNFTIEEFHKRVPLSPTANRGLRETKLNKIRILSGLKTKNIYKLSPEIREFKSKAGL